MNDAHLQVNDEDSHANDEDSHANDEDSHVNDEHSHVNVTDSHVKVEDSHVIDKHSQLNGQHSHANGEHSQCGFAARDVRKGFDLPARLNLCEAALHLHASGSRRSLSQFNVKLYGRSQTFRISGGKAASY